jgi:hypothetical protein
LTTFPLISFKTIGRASGLFSLVFWGEYEPIVKDAKGEELSVLGLHQINKLSIQFVNDDFSMLFCTKLDEGLYDS